MREITLIFVSLLVYLAIKGRLQTYIALATTAATPDKTGGSQATNQAGKSDKLTNGPIPSQISPTQNTLFNSLLGAITNPSWFIDKSPSQGAYNPSPGNPDPFAGPAGIGP